MNAKTTKGALPIPAAPRKGEKKILKQAQINQDLWDAVEIEAEKLNYTNREIFEYGLRAWLLQFNPQKAMQLGITGR